MNWQHITNRPEFIPKLARWFQDEWGHYNNQVTFESRCQNLSSRNRIDILPLTMVATIESDLLGSYSLDLADLPIRPRLGPWLASVYINPQHRNQGFGMKLVKKSMEHAQSLGISTLYLFTDNRADWYAKMGWKILEKTVYKKNAEITIMSYKF